MQKTPLSSINLSGVKKMRSAPSRPSNDVIKKTSGKYRGAFQRLTSNEIVSTEANTG
jgi:hypothetical protein